MFWIIFIGPLIVSVLLYVGYGLKWLPRQRQNGHHGNERNFNNLRSTIGSFRGGATSADVKSNRPNLKRKTYLNIALDRNKTRILKSNSQVLSKPKLDLDLDVDFKRINGGFALSNSIGSFSKNKTSDTLQRFNLIGQYHNHTLYYRSVFNCGLLFKNNPSEQEKVNLLLTRNRLKNEFPVFPPEIASSMLQNCDSFKKVRNYALESGSKKEKNFPLAYVITAHRDFEHVERLLRSLYQPQNVFCIHLDDNASRMCMFMNIMF